MNARGRNTLIAVLGVLLIVNLIIFFTYRVQQQERIEGVRERKASLEEQLQKAKADEASAKEQVASVGRLEQELDRIFNETWGRPDERLTPLLRELYRYANESGLQPSSRSYGNEQSNRPGEATSMTISFGVSGSYQQLRRLIHLIETSDQFVVIDSLGLSESEAGTSGLGISMQLRTLFREEPRGRQSAAAGGRSNS